MANNITNPLDYPRYVRGLLPAMPESLGSYVETELEKLQDSMENMAVAADANTKTQVAELKITVDSNTASITDEQTVRATADQALSDRIDTVSAEVDTNTAAITTEQQARADGDSANATSIQTVSTKVDTNTASITTLQTSVDGLEAKYGVSLNVNGYITGFQQNNNGSSGSFIITADRFAIVDPTAPAGDPGTAPFQVVGGQTLIDNAVIENLTVTKLAGGILDTGGTPITQNSDINLGTGHIVFDNGAVQLIEGVGFGSTGQFIQWFGPKQASFADCTEANATFYLKIDGSAYFGGSLSAGTIHNSAQTTNQATNASISLGPFSSNGNSIDIECSYSYTHSFNCDEGTGSVSGSGTATIAFESSTNGGSTWSPVATITADITGTVIQRAGQPDVVRITGGSSATAQWTPGVSTTLELRATLTSWSGPSASGTNITNDSISQSISVSSTEQ